MTLVFRTTKGSPLTGVEYDSNLQHFVDALLTKVDTADSRLTNARTPTAHTHVIADITGLSADLATRATTTQLNTLTATVDTKAASNDSRFTNARAIADGSYGFFSVSAGAAVATDGSITNAKLADVNTATIKGKATAGTGAPEDLTASQVRTILNVQDGATDDQTDTEIANLLIAAPSQVKADLIAALLADNTSELGVATFQDWRAGTSFSVFLTPLFEYNLTAPQTLTYGTTVNIDYGDGGSPETLDTGKARSTSIVVNATGNVDITFQNISGALIDRMVKVTAYNSGGGARAFAIITGNGVTVSHAATAVNPGLGSTAGDWVTAFVWLKSSSEAVIVSYITKV